MTPSALQPRIYLDNAATSWPKPEAVYEAVDDYQRHVGAPAGRAGYAEAVRVSQLVDDARRKLAGWIGLDDPTHLIFTSNGTDSLNMVIHGLLRQGDHVVTSVTEHNSVLRPLAHLERLGHISVARVACDGSGVIDPADVAAAIGPATRLIALSHASNVTGALQPIEAVGRLARERGVRLLCDAAQTVGHIQIDMRRLNVDFLAASGHKGLLGPLGVGILAIRPDVVHQLQSVRQGGTGTRSEQTEQPEELPHKLEAGNLNVPGILGLRAAVEFLRERGVDAIHGHGLFLTERMLAGLGCIAGVRVMGPDAAASRMPLVSIAIEGYDPQEVALTLETAYRIQVRSGLHCAPLMHESLGTQRTGGTIRFSMGAFTTIAEVDAAIEAVGEIASSRVFH